MACHSAVTVSTVAPLYPYYACCNDSFVERDPPPMNAIHPAPTESNP